MIIASEDNVIAPLYGLVLVGGGSRRMKAEKASLEYHGKPQVVYCAEMLQRSCEKVFVSSRANQRDEVAVPGVEQICDDEEGLGPLGGILTAMNAHPDHAWCVLACDMPFVKDDTLGYLLKMRNPKTCATAYISSVDGLAEPLCAVYEPSIRDALDASRRTGELSLRKVFEDVDIELLDGPEGLALTNVNTWEAYEESVAALERSKDHHHE